MKTFRLRYSKWSTAFLALATLMIFAVPARAEKSAGEKPHHEMSAEELAKAHGR